MARIVIKKRNSTEFAPPESERWKKLCALVDELAIISARTHYQEYVARMKNEKSGNLCKVLDEPAE